MEDKMAAIWTRQGLWASISFFIIIVHIVGDLQTTLGVCVRACVRACVVLLVHF